MTVITGFPEFFPSFRLIHPQGCKVGGPARFKPASPVTRTLPFGTPDDVKREMEWLVEHGPPVGFFLGASSSIAPATPWENIATMAEGLNYYQKYGRA